jgi:hypothetical protein
VRTGLVWLLVAGTLIAVARSWSAGPGFHRWALIIAGSFLLFRPTVVFMGVAWSLAIGAVTLAFGALRPAVDPLAVLARAEPAQRDAVRAYVKGYGTRRIRREHADGLRRKVRDGEIAPADLAGAEKTIAAVHYSPRDGDWARRRAKAFNMGGSGGPLRRGLFGLVVATVVGLPFALPQLLEVALALDDGGGPSTLEDIISGALGLRFPFYGLAVGYLLPLLRGATGLTKSLRVLIVLAVTEAMTIILPLSWSDETQGAILLRAVQLLFVMVALGVAFDIRSLHHAGYGIDRLGDVYGVNRITVLTSGVLLTAVTALGTTAFDSALDVMLEVVRDQLPVSDTNDGGTGAPVDGR